MYGFSVKGSVWCAHAPPHEVCTSRSYYGPYHFVTVNDPLTVWGRTGAGGGGGGKLGHIRTTGNALPAKSATRGPGVVQLGGVIVAIFLAAKELRLVFEQQGPRRGSSRNFRLQAPCSALASWS